MTTPAEKRRALLLIAGWDPGYWDDYSKDPENATASAEYHKRTKAALVVFPDEPTIKIEQRFAEDADPMKVGAAVHAAVTKSTGYTGPSAEVCNKVREIADWLESCGKKGAARIVRERFLP